MGEADGSSAPQDAASDDATHTANPQALAPSGAPALTPGKLIDRFVLLKRIGEGGMGSVWAAYDGELDRKIAIKLVLPERAADEQVRARMLREAQALARLSHPNVVTVHEVGVHEREIYVAMEHVEGETLKAWLLREPIGPARLERMLDILRQAGRGLAAAHAADMVHRDFKPANVIVGADGRVRVVDFGLARVQAGVAPVVRDELVATFRDDALRSSSGDGSERSASRSVRSGLEAAVTEVGTFVGTPRYMAPEQFEGKPVDARADQFSFCTVLFEGAFGCSPWTGTTAAKIHAQMLDGPPRLPNEIEHPAWLRAVIRRGLAPRAGQRFADMEALVAALTPERDLSTTQQGRSRWIALSWISIAVVVISALLWLRPPPVPADPCAGVGDRVAEAWGDDERAALVSSFRASRLPYAETAIAGVVASLDAYSAAWAEAATTACLLGRRSESDTRPAAQAQVACLELRLAEVTQLVALLADADAAAIESASDATAALTPISWCEHAERNASFDDDRVRALRVDLANAKTVGRLGRAADGLGRATRIADEAARHGASSLQAESLLLAGSLERRPATAIVHYEDAFWLALSAGDDDTALLAAIGAVDQSIEETEYDAWRRRAGALLRRQAAGPEQIARLSLALGRSADRQGRSVLAMWYLSAAIEGLAGSADRDPLLVMRCWWALAEVSARADPDPSFDGAFATAIELSRTRLGSGHPATARLLMARGLASAARQDFPTAIERLRAAVDIFAALPGEMTNAEIDARRGLGEVLAFNGEREQGFEQLFLAHHALTDDSSLLAAVVDRSIGTALILDGRPRDAIPLLLRAFERERRIRGDEHSDLSIVLNRLTVAQEASGDLSGALNSARRSAELLLRSQENVAASLGLANLSVLANKLGEHTLAIGYARRSITLLLGSHEADSRLCFPLRLLGLGLITLRRPRDAIAPLERALLLHEVGRHDTHERPKTQLALARALWAGDGDRSRARALAIAARDQLLGQRGGEVELAETETWLRAHPAS